MGACFLDEVVSGMHAARAWVRLLHGTWEPVVSRDSWPVVCDLRLAGQGSREFPTVPIERYADDAAPHCISERQARFVLGKIKTRMADCHLELNNDKTRIVYCKDSNRNGSHEHERFDFLGYTFRPRCARNGRRAVHQFRSSRQ
jgi:hypothetical protein